jgi:hypothetical protein
MQTEARDHITAAALDRSRTSRMYEALDNEWNRTRILANSSRQAIEHLEEAGTPWDRLFQEDNAFYNKIPRTEYLRIIADEKRWENHFRQVMLIGFAAPNPKSK